MKSLAQVRCFNLKRCFRALLRPIHLIYLVLFLSNHALACNESELRKLTFSLMQKDDYEVIVAKLKVGDLLDAEDRAIYQGFYKRALRKVLEPIEDRFEDLRPFGRGEVESMDMINGLDDPATPPIPISQNEGHPYPSYRQAVDTVRLNKYNTIRINGVELSEHAKQVIADIPDEIYLKNNRDFVFDCYQKEIDRITAPANQPLNAQNLNRLSHVTVILKQAGHFLNESAIQPESLFYSIFTRFKLHT